MNASLSLQPGGAIAEHVQKSRSRIRRLSGTCAAVCLLWGISTVQASDVRIFSDAWSGNGTDKVEDNDRGPAAASTSIDSPNAVSASFSWATGLGRAHAVTSSNGSPSGLDVARASIFADDAFTVTGDIAGSVTGTVHFKVHGNVDVFAHGGPFNGQAYVSGSLFVHDVATGLLASRADFNTGTVLVQAGDTAKSASLDETYALPFEISASHRSFSLSYTLQLYSQGHAEVDFSNTSAITLDLPPGLAYTSDSGVLLTEVPPPVPEPQTWALLIAGGLLLLGKSAALSRRQT
ncbi:MAG: hypothetical protein JNL33_10245 [Betaproteobacteria bacterium]|nr:hypothetical protein [Betaproteobacteria bacterium]